MVQGEKVRGMVVEVMPNATFKVKLEDERVIWSYLAGKMRINHIKTIPGDRVEVVLSDDKTRGRIIKRL